MSFDAKKNPVSVNNGFFDRCTAERRHRLRDRREARHLAVPGRHRASSPAPASASTASGALPVSGSGTTKSSTNGGATGWLTSQAPVNAGETFTLELMIWDTGDGVLDSSVLLDNFTWAEGAVTVSTDRPR